MCALVHEWCKCFYCLISELAFVRSDSTSLPKQITPILSSHHSIAEDRLKFTFSRLYCWPAFVMVGSLVYWTFPDELPVASMALTIFIDSVSATSPKTTCLPSNQPVTTVVMKN